MNKITKKILFYKALSVEVLETLCSVCLYLESEGRVRRNPQSMNMNSHFKMLKEASSVLRKELAEREQRKEKTMLTFGQQVLGSCIGFCIGRLIICGFKKIIEVIKNE